MSQTLQGQLRTHQIERRWRLVYPEGLPDLSDHGSLHIEQGYVPTEFEFAGGDYEMRIRRASRAGEKALYFATEKIGNGMDRRWEQREMDGEEFASRWPETEGRRIDKTRIYIPDQNTGLTIELDRFTGHQSPFTLAEVKFGDVGQAEGFEPPEWMRQLGLVEVTHIAAFQNRNLARYRDPSEHLKSFNPPGNALTDIDSSRARLVFEVIRDATFQIYSGYRSEERQIFANAKGHGPQETDSEHGQHVAMLLQVLWSNREKLGIDFGQEFDIASAMQQAPLHDIAEVWAGDVDAATTDKRLLIDKDQREIEAVGLMMAAHPYMRDLGILALEYGTKRSAEAKLISDLDKFAGIMMIIFDEGRKWKEQIGNTMPRARHDEIVSRKILTPLGQKIWEEMGRFFDGHPDLFAPETVSPLIIPVVERPYGEKGHEELGVSSKEIERKFLLSGPIDESVLIRERAKLKKIRQFYTEVSDDSEVRFRSVEESGTVRYYRTTKTGRGLERGEEETKISREDFEAAMDRGYVGKLIEKKRYALPYGELTIEIDVYLGELEGLHVLEVEFTDIDSADKLELPEWLNNLVEREVTNEPQFKNKRLASEGLPE
jgi:CYTH domain-containing protein/5'-deoxynucleotidase YfbR-like HD superfamily hydrolase